MTPGGGRDPQALRAEIERTRADLGETVAALAAKTDVKARARKSVARTLQRGGQRMSRVAGRASDKAHGARTRLAVMAALGAGGGLAIALIVLRTVRGRNR